MCRVDKKEEIVVRELFLHGIRTNAERLGIDITTFLANSDKYTLDEIYFVHQRLGDTAFRVDASIASIASFEQEATERQSAPTTLKEDVQYKVEELQTQLIHFQQHSDSYSEEALLALQQSLNRFLYPPKRKRRPSHSLFQSDDGTARDFRMDEKLARKEPVISQLAGLFQSELVRAFRTSPPNSNVPKDDGSR